MPLNLESVYSAAADPKFQPFPSRRSVVHSTEGMIACSQPLAARCGLKVLDAGGNAAVSCIQPHFQLLVTDTF
jgi:gamma-glutamyltranspeptidase/glutathione hydrolase